MNATEQFQSWLNDPYFDEKTKAELLSIRNDPKEVEDRFYKSLEFGTAGLRGIIGAGTNRMNIYTVRKATQGLANYILKYGAQDKGVAIAYDSRHMSPEFADESALCLNANGIKAYVFDSLRPTPELSFAVRYYGCIAGINITASHNPSNYNGYKVYWEDGAQITPPHDTGIMEEVGNVKDFSEVKTMSKKEAVEKGLYIVINDEVDDAYISELKKQVIHPEAIKAQASSLNIVYTPLHGTGNIPVRRVLKELGFKNIHVVPEQEKPDGDFPTVSYPNPESKEAFDLAMKMARSIDADLVLATDPDADRLGVWVKDSSGEYHSLTGNMSGCLIGEYEISQRKAVKGLPDDGALITTIVSTKLSKAIAAAYNVKYYEVLTGFKYIGQKILEFEESKKGTYLFGFEESYGCLIGTYARDKDAVAASMALCEAAAYYKSIGMTMWDAMEALYEKYGFYKEGVHSITLSGIEGLHKIQDIINGLRNDPPSELGGLKVTAFRDYKTGKIKDIATGNESPTGLPESNVLYFDLENAAWVCVRPSGTEPKLKLYYGVRGDSEASAGELAAKMEKALEHLS
jgi:phosphoglucomutase